MLIYKKGDILEATENIICHQVNADGIMDGGLARQIASRYPECEKKYRKRCIASLYDFYILKGYIDIYHINGKENKMIMNCFTQKLDFETDYEAIYECFEKILGYAKLENLSVAVPYKYGCGIAKGLWHVVESIFESLSKQFEVDIVVYEWNNGKDNRN